MVGKGFLAFAVVVLAVAADERIALVKIPEGTFLMGGDSDYDEAPVHRVTISQSFSIGATEVTIAQYRQFRPDFQGNPYYAPYASGVSWTDAAAFCEWLSRREGKPYRLPTEAEWEYVSRNDFGVKNMSAGVAEWVFDWHGLYPDGAQVDPVGPAQGIARVVRGGGLDYKASKTDGGKRLPAEMDYYRRAANRASMAPAFSSPESNIGFRVVQAPALKTAPLPYAPPQFQSAVKQTAAEIMRGPDPAKPYFHTRPLFPDLGGRDMRAVGWKIGLAPGLGSAYHNSAVQVCANGDVIAAYYNTPKEENEPAQSILSMRLRYGAEDWDFPEPWPDFADVADAAPVFWNDGRGKLWMFWGSPRLLGGPPFQFMTSMDSGATWSAVQFPKLEGVIGKFTPQPINSVVRGLDGTIFLPVDGSGGSSVLFASHDDGRTWVDTGGRTGGRHTTLVLGKDGSLIGFGGKNTNIDGFMPKSISRDGGKTYEKSKLPFQPLGSGQRPSAIRLASGRIFFVADRFDRKGDGPKGKGAFVALSEDEGATWKTRVLPDVVTTVGYTTATQGPNGIIHVVTSKNSPDLHIELNEAWVLEGGAETAQSSELHDVREYRETFANGKVKGTWSGGISADNRFLLDGEQVFYYQDGHKQWAANFRAGRRVGAETWWNLDGSMRWERSYSGDGWTWKIFDAGGGVKAESRWIGKRVVSVEGK